ncbi:glycoside hydrolase family 2 protein [Microbacterium sulfonylureivorans]|uniref:glycoside hydrolase family 2 protein n=1 Tax=Microbacterium sulfonylureivorans TaxID=2486854 RepID=UPI000FD9565E|nr:sugar-binding domain-containing protein [Microbacterium sulfonylureivorans]
MIRLRASEQDGSYPRPLLVRDQWADLNGDWGFTTDDGDAGLLAGWHAGAAGIFDRTIRVPFTLEAPLSGIGDPAPHPVVWYRRAFSTDIRNGERAILHFGAVDYRAQVWVDGALVADHSGGQASFSADITAALSDGSDHVVVVRAEDPLDDPDRPRGKQDWRRDAHAIWYRRATGVWGSVWLESVPALHIDDVDWRFDPATRRLGVSVWLSEAPARETSISVRLEHDHRALGLITAAAVSRRVELSVELPALRNAQEAKSLLWSPERPTLIDAELELCEGPTVIDTVWSYTGLRSVGTGGGAFLVNGMPTYMRSVLEQGYWPDGIWTAPSPGHLKSEVEAIVALGFNAVRIHQKVEDPRFLYWCDRLGVMVWGEIGAAYGFSPDAVELFTTEWMRSVRQRRSHPSLVAWVPFNESWGVHDIELSTPQQDFVRGVTQLTRALDPTRPVISNDGWEHVGSDILSIHDYATDPAVLSQRYATPDAVALVMAGPGPFGRRVALPGQPLGPNDAPVMLTEFGGIAFSNDDTWGYSVVSDDEEFSHDLQELFAAVHGSPILTGFCYTQLTDTAQEANGLLREDRTPKLPVEMIRRMVLGVHDPAQKAAAPIVAPHADATLAGGSV